jgi:uncharacterized protein (TIGR02271 family)
MTDVAYDTYFGRNVVDPDGQRIGKVSQVYVDDGSGQPEWLTVNTGLFRSKSSFVPLQGASLRGEDVVIAFDKSTVSGAPQVDEDQDGYLLPEEEEELYRYYGRDYGVASVAGEAMATGHDVSGPTTDDAMTRSEERLTVGTARQEVGRARLRKYVVTENVQTTVPVSHEEIRVEREPITDANRDAAMAGPDISEEEHEIVLTAERPVVQKETVPVERVRLAKETVVEEAEVNEQVRKERIDTEGVDQSGRAGR